MSATAQSVGAGGTMGRGSTQEQGLQNRGGSQQRARKQARRELTDKRMARSSMRSPTSLGLEKARTFREVLLQFLGIAQQRLSERLGSEPGRSEQGPK